MKIAAPPARAAHDRDCPATVAGLFEEVSSMADVGYALLLIGGFAVLVAMLRGLAQL